MIVQEAREISFIAVLTSTKAMGAADFLCFLREKNGRIIHCGDYDPVGLDEYLRLKTACPESAGLYLPANLEDLLFRYGKRELLLGSSGVILVWLRKTEDQEVRRIVELMDQYSVGLEQEVLLFCV